MPSISVVIPSYNRAHLLDRAIDSVLSQTLPADEIIIVNDGSTDETSSLVEAYSVKHANIKLIKQENGGVSKARNSGINSSKSEWIALLDSDDVWHEDKLEKQIKKFAQSPEYLLCHSNEIWVRNGKQVNQMKKHEKSGGYIFQRCLPLCAISPSSVLIHRNIFNEVGLFDEDLPACEDYDLWLRICARYPVLYIDEPLITKHGGHEDQLSRKYWGMDRFRIQALHKIITSNTLTEDDQHAATKMMLEKITIYLQGAEKHATTEHVEDFEAIRDKYAAKSVQQSETASFTPSAVATSK